LGSITDPLAVGPEALELEVGVAVVLEAVAVVMGVAVGLIDTTLEEVIPKEVVAMEEEEEEEGVDQEDMTLEVTTAEEVTGVDRTSI
jgi:hypothetical protein